MFNKSDNIEIMMGSDNDEAINNLFDSLLESYQEGLLTSMRGNEFVFDSIETLNYIFHKVNLKRSGTYIKTPEWTIRKKATRNCHIKKTISVFNMQLQ